MPEPDAPPARRPLLREISSHSHMSAVDRHLDDDDDDAPIIHRDDKDGYLREHNNENQAIARLVIDVLPSWSGVDATKVTVKDCSGHGGSKTFKVSAPEQRFGRGVQPAHVALHSRCETVTKDHISEPRLAAAAHALQSAGLAAPRLAEGGDWFIEEWGGTTVKKEGDTERDATDEEARARRALRSSPPHLPPHSHLARRAQLARFLAQIHAVPPGWYEPFREQLKAKHPALAAVPDGCHVWWFSARYDEWMGDWSPSTMAAFAALLPPAPASPAGARLVTVHGDYHAGNIIRATDTAARELRAIDLEFASANLAVFDIAYAIVACGIRGAKAKRGFCAAYLEAVMGETASPEQVDALAIDAEAFVLAAHFGPCTPWMIGRVSQVFAGSRTVGLTLMRYHINCVLALCDRARADTEYREVLLEKGVLELQPKPEDYKLLMPIVLCCLGGTKLVGCCWGLLPCNEKSVWNAVPEPPPLACDPAAPSVVLVKHDTDDKSSILVFEHAERFGAKPLPLTVTSHPGLALVQREPKPRGPYDHEDCSWLVMDVGLGPADKAIEVTYDDHFLQRAHDDRLLNVASWHMSAGSQIELVRERFDRDPRGTGKTRTGHGKPGGRAFHFNDDGTLSPDDGQDLCVGVRTEPVQLSLVAKDSPLRCTLQHAAALRAGDEVALTLSPPASDGVMSIVPQYEEARSFHGICMYVELGVVLAGGSALRTKFIEETWLVCETAEHQMVFDVAFGKMEVNNSVNMIQLTGDKPTMEPGCQAREFVIHEDGTISPKAAQHLVLGIQAPLSKWNKLTVAADSAWLKPKPSPGGDSGKALV